MSFVCDDGTHEGYLVALFPDEQQGVFVGHVQGRWRELSSRDETLTTRVQYLKVACSCGWRSPLLEAPAGCEFVPSIVCVPAWFEDECRALWVRHTAEVGPAKDGGYDIRTLAARIKGAGH